MKKVSTVAAKESSNFSQPKLTIGLDLGDRSSWYCVLDEQGELQGERKLSTTAKALREAFQRIPRSRIALETGTHSPGHRHIGNVPGNPNYCRSVWRILTGLQVSNRL